MMHVTKSGFLTTRPNKIGFPYNMAHLKLFLLFLQVNLKIKTLTDATSLRILHLDFLRIVCSHEHYFTLNLPFGTPLTPSANSSSPTPSIASITSQDSQSSYTSTSTLTNKGVFYELTTEFQQQHYLAGLVLRDLSDSLDTK